MGTFTNNEDPDEMPNAAFHQGVHCLLRKKIYVQKSYHPEMQYLVKSVRLKLTTSIWSFNSWDWFPTFKLWFQSSQQSVVLLKSRN